LLLHTTWLNTFIFSLQFIREDDMDNEGGWYPFHDRV
jgi:hypothetical protein